MNAAHAISMGSCWAHRAKETFEIEEGKELLQNWGVEGHYEGIGFCILGYVIEKPLISLEKKITFSEYNF